MRFFKPELWEKVNSVIKYEREQAKLEWARNDKEYSKCFRLTRQRLPEQFLLVYLNNHGFHDYLISDIKINKKPDDHGGAISIELIISNGIKKWLIKYGNVTKIYLDFVSDNKEMPFFQGKENDSWDQWGYDEFLDLGEGVISHEILFSSGKGILIFFKNISIETLAT